MKGREMRGLIYIALIVLTGCLALLYLRSVLADEPGAHRSLKYAPDISDSRSV